MDNNNNNQQWGNQGSNQQPYGQMMPQQYQQPQYGQPMQPAFVQVTKLDKASGKAPKGNKGLIIGLIVTGVLLVAAIVTIIILVVNGKDKNEEKTTEWISEPTVVVTTEQPSDTEVTTDEPTTEEPASRSIDYSNYYDTLTAARYEMNCYYWQYGYSYSDDVVIPEQRPVAFTDITGDGIDELIIMRATDDYCGVLDIFTISENGVVEKMYSDNFDMQVAGGTKYYLFKTASSDHLYAYTSISDEWTNASILEFVPATDTEMGTKELATFAEGPNEDYTELIGNYTIDGKECTADEFNDYLKQLQADATTVVMFNRNQGDDETGVSDLLDHAEDISMTYSGAVNHVVIVENPADGELPIAKPINMMFSSGAGAWSTDIVLNPDGTFSGSYHDSNMGESGDGYESTIYICMFEGKFKNITKVDDTTYKMQLESLTVISPEDDKKIEDDICYVKGEPYGISGGKTFEFYLPGTKVNNLTEAYVSWVWGLENADTMEMFGLFNVDMEQGFASY